MFAFFKRLLVGFSLLFKKSAQGAATATGMNVAPAALAPEVEHVVVKEQEDNYHKETLGKSFRQLQFERGFRERGEKLETPYATWDKGSVLPPTGIDWNKPMHPVDKKAYLEELKMTEDQFNQFRKDIEAKTKKQ